MKRRSGQLLFVLMAFGVARFACAEQSAAPRTLEDLLVAPTRHFRRSSGVQNPDLDAAVEAYDKAIEEAVKKVAPAIKTHLEKARKRGDSETAKRYGEAERVIADGGCLPRLHDLNKTARSSYEKALRRATEHCSEAYEKAVRDYTRDKDFVSVEQVKREHAEFLAHPSHRPPYVPAEAIGFRGHWYLVSAEACPLEPAIAAALKDEGSLLVIDDAQENEFIASLVGNDVRNDVRIGLFRVGNTWMVSSRKPATFFNWDVGQPNNNQNETAAGIRANGKWHDFFPNDSLLSCIEWE